jgi:hypothetical protein
VRSSPIVISRVPVGENVAARSDPVCRRSTALSLPASAAHSRALPSLQAVTSARPSGENDAAVTTPVCPRSTSIGLPVRRSASLRLRSASASRARVPSGDIAAAKRPGCGVTRPLWVSSRSPEAAFHSRAVRSAETEKMRVSSSEKAASTTAPVWSVSVRIGRPETASHRCTLWSRLAVITRVPSCENDATVIWSPWRSTFGRCTGVATAAASPCITRGGTGRPFWMLLPAALIALSSASRSLPLCWASSSASAPMRWRSASSWLRALSSASWVLLCSAMMYCHTNIASSRPSAATVPVRMLIVRRCDCAPSSARSRRSRSMSAR